MRSRKRASRREAAFYEGCTYADYLALGEEERVRAVEMDCVEGAEGDSQALPALHFVQIGFQIYVLLEWHDRAHVVAALDWLEGLMGGPETLRRVFGFIQTDRGCEFDDIAGIERDGRCRVFYADPQRSDQKGACGRR